jgi:hypothetical protein
MISSVVVPPSNAKFRAVVPPRESVTFSTRSPWYPSADTEILYDPVTGKLRAANDPDESVVIVLVKPVAELLTVTVAPAIGLALLFVTKPWTSDVVTCAWAAVLSPIVKAMAEVLRIVLNAREDRLDGMINL